MEVAKKKMAYKNTPFIPVMHTAFLALTKESFKKEQSNVFYSPSFSRVTALNILTNSFSNFLTF